MKCWSLIRLYRILATWSPTVSRLHPTRLVLDKPSLKVTMSLLTNNSNSAQVSQGMQRGSRTAWKCYTKPYVQCEVSEMHGGVWHVLLRSAWRLSDGLGMAALHTLAGRSERFGSGILELKSPLLARPVCASCFHAFLLSSSHQYDTDGLLGCLVLRLILHIRSR